MWVWSDELVERVSKDHADGSDHVPLIAYAVASEDDLDELAFEVLSGTRPETADIESVDHRAVGR